MANANPMLDAAREILALQDELVQMEETIEAHHHEPFESCAVCREGGTYHQARAKFQELAANWAASFAFALVGEKSNG